MENEFLDPAMGQTHSSVGSELACIEAVNAEMLGKLDAYLERYFSKEEIEYIKTGNAGSLTLTSGAGISPMGLFSKYFPIFRDRDGSTPEERREPQKTYYGTTEDIATKLANSDSPYFGGEKHEYKGNIATPVIMRIIELIRQKESEGKSLISKEGFFKEASEIPTISVGDFNIRLAKKQEYLDGLPLFLGELSKTCQVIGKSGSAYGLDYLLNPNVETLVFTKNIVRGDSVEEVVVGSPAICLSEDGKKIIISAIELVNTPSDIASTLIRGMAQALYEKYRDMGVEEVQVGIGARTLHDLGYDKFIDGENGCPEYNRVRAQTATAEDIEKIAKIASGTVPAVSEKEARSKKSRNLPLQSKLAACPLKADADDVRPHDSVLGVNRDIRFRISLCDETTSEALKQQVAVEKEELDAKNPSVFRRLGGIIASKFRLRSTSPDSMRREYFRE